MANVRKIVVNSAVYLAADMARKAAAIIVIPVLTAFLNPADYGKVGTLMSFRALVCAILPLGFGAAVFRQYFHFDGDADRFRAYFSSNILAILGVGGVFCLAFDQLGQPLWDSFFSGKVSFQPYVRIVLWTSYFATLLYCLCPVLRAEERPLPFAALQIGYVVLRWGCVLALVAGLAWGLEGFVWGEFAAEAALFGVCAAYIAANYITLRLGWCHIRTALSFGLPLIPTAVLFWALTLSDRLILTAHVDLAIVGHYSLASQAAGVLGAIGLAAAGAWGPTFYRLMARRDDPVTAPRLVAIADLHLSLLALGAIIAALFAGEIIMLIAPGEYLPAARYVPVLMGGALLGAAATVPATHLHFREKTGFLPLVFGLAAAANLAGNLIFVPQFGAIAAAFCFAAANAVAMVLLWRVSSPRRAVPYPSWRYALMLGLAALICLAPAFEDSPLPLALRLAVAAIFGSGVIAGVALPAVRRFGSYHPLAV